MSTDVKCYFIRRDHDGGWRIDEGLEHSSIVCGIYGECSRPYLHTWRIAVRHLLNTRKFAIDPRKVKREISTHQGLFDVNVNLTKFR